MQFFFTVDPQRVSGERTEEVLGNFFARVVFGRMME
jgi:hypothetical protein